MAETGAKKSKKLENEQDQSSLKKWSNQRRNRFESSDSGGLQPNGRRASSSCQKRDRGFEAGLG